MIRALSPIQLGGTLYIPATHKDLQAICSGQKYPQLRSCIIDTEDAIDEEEIDDAMENITQMLLCYKPGSLCVFLRPRNPEVLIELLKIENIDRIDGFSLPKFSTEVMHAYEKILRPYPFYVMPVLESRDLFSTAKLEAIRSFLLSSTLKTLCLRLGGEDMMQFLSLKRSCEESIYTLVAPAKIIAEVITLFKPFGFTITAPVFNCIGHTEAFAKAVGEDLRQGLIGKTIIHPEQIEPVNEAHRVTASEYAMALKMLDAKTKAITLQEGQMGEKFAHTAWARIILERYRYFGLK
ncbi:MAG: HpcH/HpaI aldolase/citrate lyase family protein [Campylobacterales bacterium]|nr:HpcH/HpaI aldolase/citrate lyase family protein [Campylobacterales bacterium]